MVKRHLTDEERTHNLKAVKNLEVDIEYGGYAHRYNQLQLTEGLFQQYKKKKRDYEKADRETKAQLDFNKSHLKVLKEQLRNGVEVKDPKKYSTEDVDKAVPETEE